MASEAGGRSAIRIRELSKLYRLGTVGATTLREDISRAWARLRRGDPPGPVSLHGVERVQRNHLWALRDVDLDVSHGEVVGIIGKNGAGKSTLLKIVSRITAPTTGSIKLRGRVGSLLEIGTGFHPELSGRENVYLNGAILGMSRREIDGKFDEIVAFAEVEQFIDTPVKRYSSGMHVRLGFAVAAHLQPEILVVDEVLAVGDYAFQQKCLGKIDQVSNEGRTVLFVSHNMASIKTLCSRAILLEDGRVVEDGDADATIDRYLRSSRRSVGDGQKAFTVRRENLAAEVRGFRFVDIEMSSTDAEPTIVRTGDEVVLTLAYESQLSLVSPAFMVSFRSEREEEVLRLSTMPISGFRILELHDEGLVRLRIDSLPLTAGRYTLDIGLSRSGVDWVQRLNGVAELHVTPGDVYASGHPLTQRQCLVVTDHVWNHDRREPGLRAGVASEYSAGDDATAF